jgi:3-oxoadipate enol-lactonase
VIRHLQASDGEDIAYCLDGPGNRDVIVLSHSLGTDMRLWDVQANELARHYRVLRYDIRGHGQSSVPAGAYTLARLGHDVLDLLDGLSITQASFCGVSLGGMIGQWLGHHAPQRLRCLCLCNTSAYMGSPSNWDARIASVRKGGMAAICESVLERWFTPTFRAGSSQIVETARSMLLETPPDGYVGCCAAIRDMNLSAARTLIAVPTLVIAGVFDVATPRQHAETLLRQTANGRLAMLAAAHLSSLEQPQAFSTVLCEFLAQSQ